MVIAKLFGSKNRISILAYMIFSRKESYIRQISKETSISVSIVKKEIDNLLFLGILASKGRNIFLNKDCPFLEDLKNILIKTDYMFVPLKKAFNVVNLDFVLLFGSFAKGNFSYESDVDLLVIGESNLVEVYKILKKVEKEIGRVINPVVWTKKALLEKKNSAFVRDILSKKIVMVTGDEAEFRKLVN